MWKGLDNAAWGSHVYFETVSRFNQIRLAKGDSWLSKPITLTKFGMADWRPNMSAVIAQESPAQHRFPVWWTGDGVSLQASVESMVNSGVHGFKPYVHSDCGGDTNGRSDPKKPARMLRWTAHCAMGTIHRFHGGDHRPWRYDNASEAVIRQYLTMRYKLSPSLIAAGHHVAETGTPFVQRCDLVWPEHAVNGAADPTQYLFLNDTLVAPIFDDPDPKSGMANRTVWIPPGTWQDAWDGSTVTGPKVVLAVQPAERQPMWHRKDGGFVVMTDSPGLRIEEQDWSELTLELHPSTSATVTERTLYAAPADGGREKATTHLALRTDGRGKAALEITEASDGTARAWVVRLNLRPGEVVTSALLDGVELDAEMLASSHLEAVQHRGVVFPFGGKGTAPLEQAGPVVELRLARTAHARSLAVVVAPGGHGIAAQDVSAKTDDDTFPRHSPLRWLALIALAKSAGGVDPDSFSPIFPAPVSESNGSLALQVSSSLKVTLNSSSEYVTDAAKRYTALMFAWGESDCSVGTCVRDVAIGIGNTSTELQLGVDESYTLTVSATGEVKISAPAIWGAMYALETLSQLVVWEDTGYGLAKAPWSIEDKPQFPHRGLLVDVSAAAPLRLLSKASKQPLRHRRRATSSRSRPSSGRSTRCPSTK